VPVALVTNYLTPYRVPLYERLAARHDVDVWLFGGGERYVPSWFADLDDQLEGARFASRRLDGPASAAALGRRYEVVIAPHAGGAMLPAAYAGARAHRRRFILWASVWAQPRSAAHLAASPAIHHIYRHADAVLAYGEHTRRFAAGIRGRDDDVFVAPQSVEPEVFAREVGTDETDAFRERHGLTGPFALYAGRLVAEKGVEVLLEAWPTISSDLTLVVVGDGPLAHAVGAGPRTRLLGPLPRTELPVAYAAAEFALLPSVPTRRFLEPWGLVCNEAMHQGRPVIASAAVGAVAGGLVRDEQTGLVVPPGDPRALAGAIDRLASDPTLRGRLGGAARAEVTAYNYDAMVSAFDRALTVATDARGRKPR
jgi:glycosyltransferase involved in cell wall biosynthesis